MGNAVVSERACCQNVVRDAQGRPVLSPEVVLNHSRSDSLRRLQAGVLLRQTTRLSTHSIKASSLSPTRTLGSNSSHVSLRTAAGVNSTSTPAHNSTWPRSLSNPALLPSELSPVSHADADGRDDADASSFAAGGEVLADAQPLSPEHTNGNSHTGGDAHVHKNNSNSSGSGSVTPLDIASPSERHPDPARLHHHQHHHYHQHHHQQQDPNLCAECKSSAETVRNHAPRPSNLSASEGSRSLGRTSTNSTSPSHDLARSFVTTSSISAYRDPVSEEPVRDIQPRTGKEMVVVRGRLRFIVHAREVTLRGDGLSNSGRKISTGLAQDGRRLVYVGGASGLVGVQYARPNPVKHETAEDKAIRLLQRYVRGWLARRAFKRRLHENVARRKEAEAEAERRRLKELMTTSSRMQRWREKGQVNDEEDGEDCTMLGRNLLDATDLLRQEAQRMQDEVDRQMELMFADGDSAGTRLVLISSRMEEQAILLNTFVHTAPDGVRVVPIVYDDHMESPESIVRVIMDATRGTQGKHCRARSIAFMVPSEPGMVELFFGMLTTSAKLEKDERQQRMWHSIGKMISRIGLVNSRIHFFGSGYAGGGELGAKLMTAIGKVARTTAESLLDASPSSQATMALYVDLARFRAWQRHLVRKRQEERGMLVESLSLSELALIGPKRSSLANVAAGGGQGTARRQRRGSRSDSKSPPPPASPARRNSSIAGFSAYGGGSRPSSPSARSARGSFSGLLPASPPHHDNDLSIGATGSTPVFFSPGGRQGSLRQSLGAMPGAVGVAARRRSVSEGIGNVGLPSLQGASVGGTGGGVGGGRAFGSIGSLMSSRHNSLSVPTPR